MAITSLRKPARVREDRFQRGTGSPQPMSREDICNIEPVACDELLAVLAAIGEFDGLADFDDVLDERWTLAEGGAS